MALRKILVFAAVGALVCASDIEDSEQKKRGAGKATSLNAIPTGAQKPEYTYSIYSQNPGQSSSPSYQVPNSFYPNQASQYYTSASSPTDSPYSQQPQQPQINLIPPPNPSQYVPLNFLQNPGYQSKFQILPSKGQNGQIQLALIPQPIQSQIPYPQLFSPNQGNQVHPQQNLLSAFAPNNFNIAPNFQSFGSPYLGQPSTMFLIAQPNSLYNNLVYPNPVQSFYNYYPTNSQTKYLSYGSQPNVDYERQGPVSQGVSKEDNDISAHTTNAEYLSPDTASYKNAYTSRSSAYTKH